MHKIIALLSFFMLLLPVNDIYSEEAESSELWRENDGHPMNLEVTQVNIHLASTPVEHLKKRGDNTLGGPATREGKSNFVMDGYTAPTWASGSPSVFTAEAYSFSGGSSPWIDFRTVIANNAGPWPTPIPVPNLPEEIDALGGDVWNVGVEGALHNLSDEIGDGLSSGRPWCFEVLP